MGVLLHLEGIEELDRAEQRQLGRLFEDLKQSSIGFEGFECTTVINEQKHSEWDGEFCPECDSLPQFWYLTNPSGERNKCAAKCLNCDIWLWRSPAFYFLDDEGQKSRRSNER